ncbi:MAG: hypothetical protein ACK5NY_10370 [Burkholderiaceae bacterium]
MKTDSTDTAVYAPYVHAVLRQAERRGNLVTCLTKAHGALFSLLGMAQASRLKKSVVYGALVLLVLALLSDPLTAGVFWTSIGLLGMRAMLRMWWTHRQFLNSTTALPADPIDSDFLATATLMRKAATAPGSHPTLAGRWTESALEARVYCFKWLQIRRSAVEHFLRQAALVHDKTLTRQSSTWQARLACAYRALTCYFRVALRNGRWREARHQATTQRLKTAPVLEAEHIAQWLLSETGRQALFSVIEQDALGQANYLRVKAGVRLQWLNDAAGLDTALTSDIEQMLALQQAQVEEDQAGFERCRQLLNHVKKARTSLLPAKDLPAFSRMIEVYFELPPVDFRSTVELLLGERLLHGLLTQTLAAENKLIAFELEAAR